MKKIKIYHSKLLDSGPNPWMFTPTEIFPHLGLKYPDMDQIKTHYHLMLDSELPYEGEDEYILDIIYAQVNMGTSILNKFIPRSEIVSNRTHTSTSIGDIIQIDEKYYYVDGIGFKNFDPHSLRPKKSPHMIREDGKLVNHD